MRSRSYALVFMLGMVTPSAAAFVTGNDLQAGCTGSDPGTPLTMITGYVMGQVDQIQMTDFGKGYICIPSGVQAGQVRDLVCQYVAKVPKDRHYPGSLLAYRALLEAWPCAKQ